MEKNVLIKYISHLNQSPYNSIPDDGNSEFPKLNLQGIWNFQNGLIQNFQLFHTYTEPVCPTSITSPLVVGEDAFKTMAVCKRNKVYNQKVLFIAFFTSTVTQNCLAPCLCMLILTCPTQVPVTIHSRERMACLLTRK